jgi:hypothetical protein
MKHGLFFPIPEGPTDMGRLWQGATPLVASTLPPWLDANGASGYRQIGSVLLSTLTPDEQAICQRELESLETAGVIVDSAGPSGRRDVYLAEPTCQAVFSIGIYRGDSPLCLYPAPTPQPVLTRQHVTDAVASFVADPFMVRVADGWWMFFEIMNWITQKGEIACAQSRDGLVWTYVGVVLEEPFHLSYPYVFQHDGRHFMVPESFQSSSVRLYESRRFPGDWTLVSTLIEAPYLVDASLLRYAHRWWLFAESNPGCHDTLRLYSSDVLEGPWSEHPHSPIVRNDARSARPAGRIIRLGDTFVRFAQDCSLVYGGAVHAFEIVELSQSDYRERRIARPVLAASGAGWNAGGMHHVDAQAVGGGEWMACVDGWYEGL